MDTNRFTQKSLEALQAAQQLAQSYGNAQVEQEIGRASCRERV